MTCTQIFEKLIYNVSQYQPSNDFSLLEKAYETAREAHAEQKRRSGEPYIIHPLETAVILSELYQDNETIAAAILHDVIEDTNYTYDDISSIFGDEVAILVNGVTDLRNLKFNSVEEEKAENYRKLFLSMSKDIRIIIIKIADRLHNLRTLQHMPEANQKRTAQETIDIYASLAHKLGISKLRRELEDLSLQYLHPNTYRTIDNKMRQRKVTRAEIVEATISRLEEQLKTEGIQADVVGRTKNYFNIYKKMYTENKPFNQIYDLFSVRILVESISDCYITLGVVHGLFKPLLGRFEDHIAIPKDNLYQSLHSIVTGLGGEPFEIQIRTHEMHRYSEFGITAKWWNKENTLELTNSDKSTQKINWLRDMLDWLRDISDSATYLDALKGDLNAFMGHIYCFTPKGDTKSLLAGSTAVDFAYAVHSAVGNKMIGAKVNNREVPIDTILKTGDFVEIITSQNSNGPNLEWLEFAKTSQARSRITNWFNSQNKEANITKGKELLEGAAENKDASLTELFKETYIKAVLRRYGLPDWNSVCAAVGHGSIRETQIVNRLYDEYLLSLNPTKINEKKITRKNESGIIVKGIDKPSFRLSKCCGPLIGDEIVAYATRGRGVTIHRTDCASIIGLDTPQRERLTDAEWENPHDSNPNTLYQVELSIIVKNIYGMLYDVLDILKNEKINIHVCNGRPDKTNAAISYIDVKIEVPSHKTLDRIFAQLRNINGVIKISRV